MSNEHLSPLALLRKKCQQKVKVQQALNFNEVKKKEKEDEMIHHTVYANSEFGARGRG